MLGNDVSNWENNVEIFDYGEASNPTMKPIPVFVHPPDLHQNGLTRVIPFEINEELGIDEKCTSPNLMASFVRICVGENNDAKQRLSQTFYVIERVKLLQNMVKYGILVIYLYCHLLMEYKSLCLQDKEYGGAACIGFTMNI